MKKTKIIIVFLIILFLSLSTYLFFITTSKPFQQENMTIFNNANNFYQQKEYNKSILLYKLLINKGITNADIYYNLANSYYKNKQFAEALVNYKNAEILAPRNADIKANIKFIIDQYTNNDEAIKPTYQTILFWYHYLNLEELIKLTIITSLLVCSIGVIYIFYKHVLTSSLFYIGIIILITLFLSTFIKIYKNYNYSEGIITKNSGLLKSGNNESFSTLGNLVLGDEVKILEKKGNWYKIKLNNDKKGWANKHYVSLIDAHM